MPKKLPAKGTAVAKAGLEPLLLYSTVTWLAYSICQNYYGGVHYVWCTPHFDQTTAPPGVIVPPTSCPKEIYRSLENEVANGDRHSAKIDSNKIGILTGAGAHLVNGSISQSQYDEIVAIVTIAAVPDFKPMLLVIPYAGVKNLVTSVPVKDRAHPTSPEFIINSLPDNLFHAIRL